MLFDYCRAQADTAASDIVPMDLSMLCRGGKGKKGKGDKKGKGKGKAMKGEDNKDERDKGKSKVKGKGKGKNNAKVTEYFAGYCLTKRDCLHCKGWKHMKKDCWWNSDQQEVISLRRRAIRRFAHAHEMVSTCLETFRSRPRILDCRGLSSHLGGTDVRQRQHLHVPQYRWDDTQRIYLQKN